MISYHKFIILCVIIANGFNETQFVCQRTLAQFQYKVSYVVILAAEFPQEVSVLQQDGH